MLTLLHELYTVVKYYKIAPNLVNSIDLKLQYEIEHSVNP